MPATSSFCDGIPDGEFRSLSRPMFFTDPVELQYEGSNTHNHYPNIPPSTSFSRSSMGIQQQHQQLNKQQQQHHLQQQEQPQPIHEQQPQNYNFRGGSPFLARTNLPIIPDLTTNDSYSTTRSLTSNNAPSLKRPMNPFISKDEMGGSFREYPSNTDQGSVNTIDAKYFSNTLFSENFGGGDDFQETKSTGLGKVVKDEPMPNQNQNQNQSITRQSPEFYSEKSELNGMPFSDSPPTFESLQDSFALERLKQKTMTNVKNCYNIFKLVSILTVLMFIPPILELLVTTSCRENSNFCIPKVEFQFTDDTADSPLATIHDSIKVVSYFAMDLGTNKVNTEFSDEEIDGIDSFSIENIYRLNYFGYCRFNYMNNIESCDTFSSGLDLASVLVRDAGVRLSMISKQGNPSDIGNSLVSAYHALLEHIGTRNETAYNALILKYTGETLPYLVSISIAASTICLIVMVVLTCLLLSNDKFQKIGPKLTMIFILLNFASLISLTLSILDLGAEYIYVIKLNNMVLSQELAVADLGSGFIIHLAATFVQGTICLGLLLMLYFRPWTSIMK